MSLSALQNNILLPRSLDSVLARTHCLHHLHSLGSILARCYLTLKKLFGQQWRPHPTGYPFNIWVESSKCRLISCNYTISIQTAHFVRTIRFGHYFRGLKSKIIASIKNIIGYETVMSLWCSGEQLSHYFAQKDTEWLKL